MADRTKWQTPGRANNWLSAGVAASRVIDVTQEIAADSTSIVVLRGGSSLAAQTVRLLQPESGSKSASEGGTVAQTGIMVLGLPTLDIQRDDRFVVGGQFYVVTYVAPLQNNRREASAVQVQ